MSVKKYLTLNGLTYFLNKIKTYLTSSTYLDSIGISNSDIDDIADDAGYSSGSLPASEDIYITGDIIPNTDNTVDLGASSKNIKMLYTKGITINGTQFLPSNYMTLNTVQTVTSAKNYSGVQSINAYRLHIKCPIQEKGVIPASNQWNGITFNDKNDEVMFSIEQGVMANGVIQVNFSGRAYDNDTTYINFLRYINSSDLTTNVVNVIDLLPFGNGTRKLGDTNAKWKSFNGVNPGALSYPNKTSYINIDTTNWDLTCSNQGVMANYVVEQSGWLELQIIHRSADIVDFWVITGSIRMNNKSTFNTLDNRNFNMISLPVVEGDTLIIYGNASQYVAGRQIDHARIYTGLGQA